MSALKLAAILIIFVFLGCIAVLSYAIAIAVCGGVETCIDIRQAFQHRSAP